MTVSVDDIRLAAGILESGGVVAFPTETVYGLGADAENESAVAKIFAIKGRPSDHPLIVHLAPGADIAYWACEVSEAAHKLIAAFWPGPLTLILKRAQNIPEAVSGGQASIGLRCPSHPVAQALIRAFKQGRGGVAAPSANRFGHVSPTTAQHVREEFGDDQRIGAILDGGRSDVGIESTILDLTRWETHGPVLLRPGHISIESIEKVIGVAPQAADDSAPRASGTLDAHYAPRTAVALVTPEQLEGTLARLNTSGKRIALMRYSLSELPGVVSQFALPDEPVGYAHHLYAALRSLDNVGADLILVEIPPASARWVGVNDRLRRAAHDSIGVLERFGELQS